MHSGTGFPESYQLSALNFIRFSHPAVYGRFTAEPINLFY